MPDFTDLEIVVMRFAINDSVHYYIDHISKLELSLARARAGSSERLIQILEDQLIICQQRLNACYSVSDKLHDMQWENATAGE